MGWRRICGTLRPGAALPLRSSPEPKLAADQAAEAIPNFGMSWNASLAAALLIQIDVVPTAVSVEDAAGGFEFADEISAVHTKTSISLVWAFSEGGGPSSSIIIR